LLLSGCGAAQRDSERSNATKCACATYLPVPTEPGESESCRKRPGHVCLRGFWEDTEVLEIVGLIKSDDTRPVILIEFWEHPWEPRREARATTCDRYGGGVHFLTLPSKKPGETPIGGWRIAGRSEFVK
jgi:hypothetical protein